MLLNDKIKLNKFKKVEIPSMKTLYMRGMPQLTMPTGAYTGDDVYLPDIPNNKAQANYTAEEWVKYEAMMAEYERRREAEKPTEEPKSSE